MKAYGVPRVRNLQWPERPEFIRFGLKKFKMTSKVKKQREESGKSLLVEQLRRSTMAWLVQLPHPRPNKGG